jgi:alkylation response protein AidB-like acyl-CoA dehydrogenase
MSVDRRHELDEFRGTVRRFLAAKSDSGALRRQLGTPAGFDPAVWRQMAGQLGLQGLPIPEAYGGAGFSMIEAGVVFEEMGRVLFAGPYWSTVGLAAQLLLATDDEDAKKEWLPQIADGSLIAAVAVTDERDSAVSARADGAHGGWTVTGTKTLVVDGCAADLLIVAARTGQGLGLFAVEGGAEGVQRTPLEGLDLTRRLSTVALSSARGRLIAGDGEPALSRALDLAAVALAAEQAGAAQRCLEMAVDYAKTRVQFGRPIGSFQAIKHKCADMLLQVESAKAAAAAAAAANAQELPVLAALAGAYCSDAFCDVAMENIQIHGGIGFTWEHDAHLYFRRAWSSRVLVSAPERHRNRVAELIGL